MTIPEPVQYPLPDLADDLKISTSKLDVYLKAGQLTASIYCTGVVLLSEVNLECYGELEWVITECKDPEPAEIGIYDIMSYRNILWDDHGTLNQKAANLCDFEIFLLKDGKHYSPATNYTIYKDDLFVTALNKKIFESFNDQTNNSLHIPAQEAYGFPGDEVNLNTDVHSEPVILAEQSTVSTKTQTKATSTPPDVTGRRGGLKSLILGGLQDFYVEKKRVPEKGNGFNEFISFVHTRFITTPKPTYCDLIVGVLKATIGTDKCICERKRDGKKWYARKYIEKRFSQYRKEFTPIIDTPQEPLP